MNRTIVLLSLILLAFILGSAGWGSAASTSSKGAAVLVSSGACDVDFDRSGLVSAGDITRVASRWPARLGGSTYDAHYDLDKDGDIDVVDIMLVATHWGASYSAWAENRSNQTTCAEEDNVNVPIFAFPGNVSRFRVVATHPTYEVGVDNCNPNFSGCPTPTPGSPPPPDVCTKIYDDGINVVRVCTMSEWWRPYTMTVVVPGRTADAHYLELYRKIQGANEWPEFMVLYEDGNMRLIPHPPMGRLSVCWGSSVIVGPAVPAVRPYVDIQEVRVTPTPLSLDITYRNGGTAHLDISVDRNQAVVEVQVNYDLTNPFVTFRSMWVVDGNADVDHIQNQDGDFPILGNWTCLT